MSRRRSIIQPRTPVFLGCEGESEQSYGQFLNDIINERRLPYHIEVVNLSPGAGDPRSRLMRAQKEIQKHARNRVKFRYAALLMDSDQIDGISGMRELLSAEAAICEIGIIWQTPCHEAFLLNHFDGFMSSAPPTSVLAERELRQVWPEYSKPMTRQQLRRRITFTNALRLSASHPTFAALLQNIGLL